jgi:hypothetical protein
MPGTITFVSVLGLVVVLTSAITPFVASARPDSEIKPMRCGVFLYYHIAKTGGTSMRNYFKSKVGKAKHLRLYADFAKKKGDSKFPNIFGSKNAGNVQALINSFVENPSPPIVWYLHHQSPALYCLKDMLIDARKKLEAKGCNLWVAFTLREPISHHISVVDFVSYYATKHGYDGGYYNSERLMCYATFTNRQLKYLLYNHPGPNRAPDGSATLNCSTPLIQMKDPDQQPWEKDQVMFWQCPRFAYPDNHRLEMTSTQLQQIDEVFGFTNMFCTLEDRWKCMNRIATVLQLDARAPHHNKNPQKSKISDTQMAAITHLERQSSEYYRRAIELQAAADKESNFI